MSDTKFTDTLRKTLNETNYCLGCDGTNPNCIFKECIMYPSYSDAHKKNYTAICDENRKGPHCSCDTNCSSCLFSQDKTDCNHCDYCL